ncbi:hypothetical protein [[Kitasatospora] papulosa]|uniref:hypothetical protein n=1 Tax=[Kitasatospora] papulosa TaxID=1464011 RepID=UPI00403C026A
MPNPTAEIILTASRHLGLADSEAFERQARAAVPGGPAALSAPTPRLPTARPAPLPAPRSAPAHR